MRPIFPQLPVKAEGVFPWLPAFIRTLIDELIKRDPIYTTRYTVVAGDVSLGAITIDTGYHAITWYTYRLQTSATNNAEVTWTGNLAIDEGLMIFTNVGATPFAAGNILTVMAKGI
jgi:hypothetical protein